MNDLERRFASRLITDPSLNRSLVSFQANKSEPFHRWFKYKEAFSKALVQRFIGDSESFLDPFAGCGTAVITAAQRGLRATGIELLPVGNFIMESYRLLATTDQKTLTEWVKMIRQRERNGPQRPFPHLRITERAFNEETETALAAYLGWLDRQPDTLRKFGTFVLLTIIEDISYTEKAGQCLRWDHRSGKTTGTYEKREILPFEQALEEKCSQIERDQRLLPIGNVSFDLLKGSNFDWLDRLPARSYDVVITSPPYCNRYDYTRIYALELALLGCGEDDIKRLRQELLFCTVENRTKEFSSIETSSEYVGAKNWFENDPDMQVIIAQMEEKKTSGALNNNGVARMVAGYLWEMTLHVWQLARTVRPDGRVVMVNDNVRYAGLDIPIDLLLSSAAEAAGFVCDRIAVLPISKGNSSQQMAAYGKAGLRKTVYQWRRLN